MDEKIKESQESLEDLYVFTTRTIFIKVTYFLVAIFAELFFIDIPMIIFLTIFFMAAYPVIIYFLAKRYTGKPKAILNTLFLLCLLDILLLTVIINFLGLTIYVVYSFYIILGFMTLPRSRGGFLLAWITFLYISLATLQHFQIFHALSTFSIEEISAHSLGYVSVMTAVYLFTLLFLIMRCYDFYKAIEKRINAVRLIQANLEDEKRSLEIRIRARTKALEEEKKTLEKRISRRKEELQNESRDLEGKIEELERFKQAAQGREEKIKELEKILLQAKK